MCARESEGEEREGEEEDERMKKRIYTSGLDPL